MELRLTVLLNSILNIFQIFQFKPSLCSFGHLQHLEKMAVVSYNKIHTLRYLSKEGSKRTIVFLVGCDLFGFRMIERSVVNGLVPNDIDEEPCIQYGVAASRSDTGNKPQTASAGRDVVQINYYGSDYAQAMNSANAQVCPETFTKPIQALGTLGTALKSPTVEECGYSDRIMQLTAGNSTITTQEAASAVVAYATWPDYLDGSGEAIDKLTTPGPAVDRFYTFDSLEWTSSFFGHYWRFPGCLAEMGMFGQNCQYHYLMRSGFCIHVQVNASKFHQGMLMVVAIPEMYSTSLSGLSDSGPIPFGDAWFTEYPVAQLTLFPHQFINLRTNNSATIILPYVNSVPAECAVTHNYWSLVIVPIVPIQVAAGGATIVPITLSVAPMSSSFSGLRQAVPIAQGGVPVHSVPGSGQFLTTLRQSGYPVYPEFEATHGHQIPGKVHNLVEVMQVDTFCQVGVTATPFCIQLGARTTTPIASWDMDLNATFLSSSYLARCAKFYTNYRGSVRLTFTFCGAAMTTGKLLLAYTPPGGDAPASRSAAMLGTHVVWDIGLQSSCTLVVPWISQTQYRFPNTGASAYNYAGYITVWYQTSIVYPPGGVPTSYMTVMIGACDDFQMRMPTDNAYYQGIGDEIANILTKDVKTKMESVQMPAIEGPSLPGQLTAVTGDSSALTAVETGASASVSPGTVMETRQVPVSFSARETDIENFMSKYALFYQAEASFTGSSTAVFNVPLVFSDTATTQTALRTKYRMFTYVRCNFDMVIVAVPLWQNVANQGVDYTMQMIYCPPGTPVPGSISAAEWTLPTTPSVYFKTSDPPASVRIPFVSVANAYTSFYDGFSNFSDGTYGLNPANNIGGVYIRPVTYTNTSNVQIRFKIMLFARPVNLSVWCPRPIVSNLTTRAISSRSRHRIYVDPSGEEEIQIGQGPFGTDLRAWRQGYASYGLDDEPMDVTTGIELRHLPSRIQDTAAKCLVMWNNLHGHDSYFTGIPVAHNMVFINYHYYSPDVRILTSCGRYWSKADLECAVEIIPSEVKHFPEKDLTILYFEDNTVTPVPIVDCSFVKDSWIVDCAGPNQNTAIYVANGWYKEKITMAPTEVWHGTLPVRNQWDLIQCPVHTGQGWCGSPLINERGEVHGFVTAGRENVTFCQSMIALPHPMPEYQHYWPKEIKDQMQHQRKRQRTEAHKALKCRVPPPEAVYQYGPEPQGLKSYLASVCHDFGSAFGSGTSESIKSTVEGLIPKTLTDIRGNAMKTALSWLVKVICACVIISNAEDKAASAASVGVILGVDLLMDSPFAWLKDKIHEMVCGCRRKRKQGMADWIKDFNAACNAARGLDWIGEKIAKFVSWLKSLWEKEDPERRAFMDHLKHLPSIIESVDKVCANRAAYRDEDVRKLANNVRILKQGADRWGIERNFATSQIIKCLARIEAAERTCSTNRVEPVAICIHGTPGTGKSLATKLIGMALSRMCGGADPYCLPPDPKHFDGYAQQPVVIMDDICQNPDGEDMKLFCQMVSSTDFQVPMAALEEKGMTFRSSFVLCSTNSNVIAPPTVCEPAALQRRFYLDLEIELEHNYSVLRGTRLDASRALDPCWKTDGCQTKHFPNCCPLICGKAVKFRERSTRQLYTLDKIVELLWAEKTRRECCGDKIMALFSDKVVTPQGKVKVIRPECTTSGSIEHRMVTVDETEYPFPYQSWDSGACQLKTYEEICKMNGVSLKPCPEAIIDLLQAVPDQKIVSWCADQGYLLPCKVEVECTRGEIETWMERLGTGLTLLSGLISVAGLILVVYKLFAKPQGAYTGTAQKPAPKKPVPRVVVAQGGSMEFGRKLMDSSLFDVKTDEGWFSGLGLYGQWFLLPGHAHPGDQVELEGITFNVVDVVSLHNKSGSLELVAVKIDRPVNFRDIRKYFKDSFSPEHGCTLLVNNKHYPRMFAPVGSVTSYGRIMLNFDPVQNTCIYHYPTRSGQCGGVVVSPQNKILAMHIGGDGANGYGAILKASLFTRLDAEPQSQGEIVFKGPSKHKPINVSTKTSLHPSVFYNVFPGTKEPAALHFKDKRLKVDLDQAMFSKYKGNVKVPECPELDLAVEHYVSQIQQVLPDDVTKPLDLEEVVYGIENLEGLDLNTSAGYPYVTMGVRKRDLIPEKGEPLTRLRDALDLHGFDQPYVTYLKDELRPIAKVEQGKTRLIECSSLNDTIRMKQMLGRLFQSFHANPGVITGSAVGCNPDLHWSKFYAEMGDQPLLAFDYSNYDASLHPMWFDAVKKVLKSIGYDDSVNKLIDHVKNSKHLYKGIEYDVEGGMPSGCSGTSIFNSIINNLIIRTLVLRCYKGIDLDSLKIIAYGDDVIASYPWPLDAKLLADEGALFGLTMTPADKSIEFNEVTWDTVTFLKRKFVPDCDFPFLIHPVFPMSEIFESLRWTRNASHTQEHVQSLCYLAWHAGQQEYEKLLERIRTVPVGRALFLPSYAVLRHQWLEQF